jgi:hypothetical protein
MNIIYEIAAYIAAAGYGTLGVDVFIGSFPDELENGIMVVSTSSGDNRKDYPVYETNFEVWTRNKTVTNGYDKAKNVFNLLHNKENINTTNAHIFFIHAPNGVESIGRDINGRALHKVLVNITYRDPLIS